MRERPPRLRRYPSLALILLPLLLLGACGGAPQKAPPTEPDSTLQPPTEEGMEALRLPASEFREQFAAAEAALLKFDWMGAERALAEIPPDQRSSTDRVYVHYLEARIHYLRGDRAAADSALTAAVDIDPALTSKVLNFQRHRAELSGDYLESARISQRMAERTRSPEAGAALKRITWRNLQRLDSEALGAASGRPGIDSDWRAWLELAQLSHADNHSELLAGLNRWLEENPGHPATQPLPGGLDLLLQGQGGPDQVALLLPLSGRLAPAGKAVRDGYLASYYTALASKGDAEYELRVYDRLAFDSTASAYRTAVANGADLVVGPLTRQAVLELGSEPGRPVPVLALNRVEQPLAQAGSALVQYSLAAEDEASHLASLAFGRGGRSAMVVRPAGSWGSKMERALVERWRGLGGRIATTAAYDSAEEYADSLQAAMGLADSEQRARDLRARLGLDSELEFTARRRQDLDTVFLLSRTPAEARALKPLLSYYYAGDLPVYATSSVHRGIPEPGDKDLDGVLLVETPWLLGANPELRRVIAAGNTGGDAYTRLNALGADAHRLQSAFRQLQAGPDALIRGDTGLLTMDPQLRIRRETRLATFDGGVLSPK